MHTKSAAFLVLNCTKKISCVTDIGYLLRDTNLSNMGTMMEIIKKKGLNKLMRMPISNTI